MAELTGRDWLDSREKRSQDLRLAALLLPIGTAAMCAGGVALIIEGNTQPLLAQERIGKDGAAFNMYKLRTMLGADRQDASFGATDPRATKVGCILRKLTIDETPQLLNVCKGDMAIVGSRPLVSQDIELMRDTLDKNDFNEWYNAYTYARPGMVSQFSNESRQYIPQSEDYLRMRAKRDIEYHEIASKDLDREIMRNSLAVGVQYVQKLFPKDSSKPNSLS